MTPHHTEADQEMAYNAACAVNVQYTPTKHDLTDVIRTILETVIAPLRARITELENKS